MRPPRFRPRFLAASLVVAPCVAACLLVTAWASAQDARGPGEIHRSIDAAADGVVEVTNVSGSVVVSGWDRPRVEVAGSVGRGVEDLTFTRRGQRVVVSVSQTLRRSASADLELRVPRGSRLVVEGMQSDVRVSGVAGDISVRTMTGTIGVSGAGGRLELGTVSGVLDVEGSLERARLENVSGPIRVRAEIVSLDAESVNGPLDLEVEGLADGRIGNVTGPTVARLGVVAGARVEISSFRGRVELAIDPSASAVVEATTRGGRIVDELGGEGEMTEDDDGRSLRRELGTDADGSPARYILRSFSGDLRLVRR